jgi:hypothetical protein
MSSPAATSVNTGPIPTLFHIQRATPLVRAMAPALVASVAFQAAATELALGETLHSQTRFPKDRRRQPRS